MINKSARYFLYFFSLVFFAIGLASLIQPGTMSTLFGLLPQSNSGLIETRAIYGGGFLSWSVITIGALRCPRLSSGFLFAMMTTMGLIAAARIIGAIVVGEFVATLPAAAGEILIVIACGVVYRHNKKTVSQNWYKAA